jgi:ABC-type transport system involved in multi-copper enzyme maturation permease subunit
MRASGSSANLLAMTFLPIAGRELAVAARRPGTYRLRSYAVLIALILLGSVSLSNVPTGQLGHVILTALGVAALGFCMLAGLLLTAGSIAAEKQGGTIGLLFLTDLKGYDIVLGKLVAHSITAFFGLLALFPVLALPLLMGSVTGAEFSRTMLVLATTLIFSLSLGLAVSAVSSDPKQALGWAMMLMGVVAGLLPALWWLQNLSINTRWLDFLLWPSPAFALRHGFDAWHSSPSGASSYWHSIATLWLLTALCLAWASIATPRVWQTDGLNPRARRSPRRKPRRWEEAEAANPFCCVTIRDRAPSSLSNLLLGVTVPIWLCFLFLSTKAPKVGAPVAFVTCLFMGCGLHALVKLLMMVESVSRINHDRQSGALELLLVTPLPVKSIISAQKQALVAHFRPSLWTLCLLNTALLGWVLAFWQPLKIDNSDTWIFAELFIGGMLALLGDFSALHWMGMWNGLSKAQAYKAVIITAIQVLGPCWVLAFLLIFGQPNLGTRVDVAIIFAVWFLVGFVTDAVIGVRARSRLIGTFRSTAANRYDK